VKSCRWKSINPYENRTVDEIVTLARYIIIHNHPRCFAGCVPFIKLFPHNFGNERWLVAVTQKIKGENCV
jgi:hypothetical protein